jgi:tryptophan synthase alpha chain
VPIGLLVYANLVVRRGLETFYTAAAQAGVDSVLIADVPVAESAPFAAAARAAGVDHVMIVPPNADPARIAQIVERSSGYTYVTTRSGVTGDDGHADPDLPARLSALRAAGAAPPVLGFGIATPAQVRSAIAAGAAGAIAGSAVVRRIAEHLGAPSRAAAEVATLVRAMRAAAAGNGHSGIAPEDPPAEV